MLTVTHTTITREELWRALRRMPEGRVCERYPSMLLLLDGNSGPKTAQWLDRDEESMRRWVPVFSRPSPPPRPS